MQEIRRGDLLTYDRKDDCLEYGVRYEVLGISRDFNGTDTVMVMCKWGFHSWHGMYKFKKLSVARNQIINDILG